MSEILFKEIETGIEFLKNRGYWESELPKSILENIKQPLRDYQKKALENFIFYCEDKHYSKIENKHLLFHMATGSGKTNIIASTILYLYEKGYRDFIFFVNTQNIITKTKDNLLNKYSQKYLFKEDIKIDNKQININEITDTFDVSKKDDINILFTTINKLHGDLETTIKENSITYADFENRKIVLIADEAHHLNANTKSLKDSEKDWETTTKNLLKSNKENILLEFTATQDLSDINIASKYKDKIIYDYALKKFRDDGYSKDIKLISDNLNDIERMLQAVLISEYRRIIANEVLKKVIKPVILFKTVRNTENIDTIYEEFIKLVENLSSKDIENIFEKSSLEVIVKLKEKITDINSFLSAIKYGFKKDSCLVIHSKTKDKEEKLKYLNSLEDVNNPIRAIFAVDILNEGWDVLNLFDIVKLDEMKKNTSSTISEAQLIGRGARYFPFVYEDYDKYKRKFDKYPSEEAKILEEMYFHSINQSEYISAIRKELVKIGLIDENEDNYKTVELKVKEQFLNSDLYKYGYIFTNKQINQDRIKINTISDYINSYKTQKFKIDNQSREIKVYDEDDEVVQDSDFRFTAKFKISEIDKDIARVAINKKPFFYFSNLKKYFPNLKSIDEFIGSTNYLGDIEFVFHTSKEFLLDDEIKIEYILKVLEKLEKEILKNSNSKIGSLKFYPHRINLKIPAKKLLKQKDSSAKISRVEDWYIFEPHECTTEEQHFVEFIKGVIPNLQEKYKDIKLIRNEKSFEIYSFDKKTDGARFEPDFILLLEDNKKTIHQIFCEPKGNHLVEFDKWKDDFLRDITKCTNDNKILLESINNDGLELYESKSYKILGLPFYNFKDEDSFKNEFYSLSKI
ncbi:DEAD/DEAH box helicase family protein [Arcobacter vandammei]|uniref:DEAD/DEAH box helicase family protein n=1 Tax=Arcobacter vandammei TaxID=2782243 RepID=UPI0018DF29DB|nr:DEAD/DEAH box helicase family protein [Arcobacter vandammei]